MIRKKVASLFNTQDFTYRAHNSVMAAILAEGGEFPSHSSVIWIPHIGSPVPKGPQDGSAGGKERERAQSTATS